VSRHPWASALLASTLALSSFAYAASDADLAQIREQIRQIKEDYEARIRALEERLKAAEAAVATPAPAVAPAPVGVPSVGGTSPFAAFNPGISVVLQGNYQSLSKSPDQYGFNNIQLGDEVTPGRRGWGLGESELNLFASVDHLFAGNLTIALAPDNEVEVEEAYGVATAVPYGFVPKFGRFFSGIGYLNEQHQHAWDFQDAPLVYQAFLGRQFAQDGVQIKWVAPTDLFLEFGAEVGNGDAFPGSERNSNGSGAWSAFVHAGGDVGANASWRGGVSYLKTKAGDRVGTQPDTGGNIVQTSFAGDTQTTIADFVWKYAPTGNAKDVNIKLQGEYFWQRSKGTLTYDSDGALGATNTDAYRASQSGFYLQGIWQFMPMWRVGARYDRLNPRTPQYGTNIEFLETGAFHPQKWTAMVDWTPSEFSRVRLQYAQNKERPGFTDNEFFVQYILSLGAHPGHKY
jgi:hypothetical protein